MTAPVIPGAEPLSVVGGDAGVLVLHGFTGNPTSMRAIAEAAAAAGLSVEMPLLPGHGTSIDDMLLTDFNDWQAAAEAAYQTLKARCSKVAVVGLSMGGCLTAGLAADHPEISGIACLNALVSEPEGIREFAQLVLDGGDEKMPGVGSDIKKAGAIETAYTEVPVRGLISLISAAGALSGRLSEISCPVLIVSSPEDHVVPPSNSDLLAESVSGPVERVNAANSYHVVTLDNDGPMVIAAVVDFCSKVLV